MTDPVSHCKGHNEPEIISMMLMFIVHILNDEKVPAFKTKFDFFSPTFVR